MHSLTISVLIALGLASLVLPVWILSEDRRPKDEIPNYGTRTRGCPYDPLSLTVLLDRFLLEWKTTFHGWSSVRAALDEVDIHFLDVDFFFDEDKQHTSSSLDSKGRIRVACRGRTSVERTALLRELVHLALWVTEGHPDVHIDSRLRGWTSDHDALIRRVTNFMTSREKALSGKRSDL